MDQVPRTVLLSLLILPLGASTAAAQTGFEWPPHLEPAPSCIHPSSHVSIVLEGTWHDLGPPDSLRVHRIDGNIEIDVYAPGSVLPVIRITPWTLTAHLGQLPPGTYDIYSTAWYTSSTAPPARPRTFAGTIVVDPACPEPCYANCDGTTSEPVLNVDDFTCFINGFATAQSLPHEQQVVHYANCDGSTTAPALSVDDLTCFINAFAAGCP